MTKTGYCNHGINTSISKANLAFAMLKSVYIATNISVHTMIKMFENSVLSVLLYGAECWKTTVTIKRKLEVFQSKCIQRIHKIYEELRNRTGMGDLAEIIQTRRWRLLEYVCRMPSNSITRTALTWIPQGKR